MTNAGASADLSRLEERLKAQAYGLGFDLAGITALGAPDSLVEYDEWVAKGYAGEMRYLTGNGATLRHDSRRPEPGMRSALVVALNYGGTQPPGPIARYARGDDYHAVMRAKLDELGRWLATATGVRLRTRAYVDTGPILERDLARRAGLGWFGKNTTLINPAIGSFFFIGALFTDLDLSPDAPFEADRCGTCTRCLDACPTDAFPAPRTLDATRCISYLTIELKGPVPRELRELMGELLYGCDICQDVCPWNIRFSRDLTEPALAPRPDRTAPDAATLLALTQAEWRERFGKSAMTRTRRRGLARNAAIALGNRRDRATTRVTIRALATALRTDPEPLVRVHAAWALGQFEDVLDAHTALALAWETESDPAVRAELATLRDAPRPDPVPLPPIHLPPSALRPVHSARARLAAFKRTQPRTPHLTHATVSARGLSFAVFVSPEVSGAPPLLCVNGGMLYSHAILWPALAPLAARRRLVLYDQRGRGASQVPPAPRASRIEYDAGDIAAIREAMGISRWDVLGHSWGGAIAMLGAGRDVPGTRRLVLVDAVGPTSEWIASLHGDAIARLDGAARETLVALDPVSLYSDDPATHGEYSRALYPSYFADAEFARTIAPPHEESVVGAAVAARLRREGYDWRATLPGIAATTLLVHGAQDVIPARLAAGNAALIPRSRVEIIDGAGHMPFLEQPDRFFSTVGAFLDEPDRGT